MHRNTRIALICLTLLLLAALSCCGAQGARWLVREFVLRFGEEETVYVSEQQAEVVPTTTSTPIPKEPYLLWDMRMSQEPLIEGEWAYIIDSIGDVGAIHLPTKTKLWVWDYYERAEEFLAQTEDMLYVLREDNRIYALDKESGETVWKYRFSDRPSEYIFHDDRFYLLWSDASLYYCEEGITALDAETGKKLWKLSFSCLALIHKVEEGSIFVTNREDANSKPEGWILDAATGEVRAKIPEVKRWGDPVTDSAAFLVTKEGTGRSNPEILGVNYREGVVIWEFSGGYPIKVFQEDMVLVRSTAGADAYAVLDTHTGRNLWGSFSHRGFKYAGSLGELGFFVSEDLGETRAVELESGEVRWANDEMKADWPVAVTEYGLLLANRYEGRLYLVDLEDGSFVWRFVHEDQNDLAKYISDVLRVGDELLVAGGSYLHLLDLETGYVEWKSEKMRTAWKVRTLHRTGDLIVISAEDYLAVFRYAR